LIFISAQESQSLLDWPSAVDAMAAAYAAELPASATPRRSIAQIGDTWLRAMPAITPSGRFLGTKQIVRTGGKVTYLIALFDRRDASLAYLIDGIEITRIRTAATTVAALRLLGAGKGIRLGVLGSGLEAKTHVEALANSCAVERLRVFSPTPENRASFARRCSEQFGFTAEAANSPEAAVRDATHIIAAARSRDESPILRADMIAPGALVASIGSTVPSQRELDIDVIAKASLIVADEPEELAKETGDMIAAAGAGITFVDRLFSLRQLLRGSIPARFTQNPALTLFKSLGSALQDLVFAERLVEAAALAGVGTTLPAGLSRNRVCAASNRRSDREQIWPSTGRTKRALGPANT
jgi:alanine dehydrogenase